MRIKIVIRKPGLEARRLFFKRNYWLILKLLKQANSLSSASGRVHLVLEDDLPLSQEEEHADHTLLHSEEDNLSQKEVHYTFEVEEEQAAPADEALDEEEFILSDAVEEPTDTEPAPALEESSEFNLDLDTDEGLGDFNFDEIQ
jgi:hypothetical protein